jgi:hypothetical protein
MENILTYYEKDRIDSLCKDYLISNYTINSDSTIDVDGDVSFRNENFEILPLQFGKVSGSFNCGNNKLISLIGAPHTVGRNFTCSFNKLTSLIGSPDLVGGNFICGYNKLTSLVGLSESIGSIFTCNGTTTLVSTYTGIVDVDIVGYAEIIDSFLPLLIIDNIEHLSIILKYQRHFYIWNDDLTLNVDNFNELLFEINDGLK